MTKEFSRKRVLVTGGAGFIGSHLVDQLIRLGASVTVVDNFITGNKANLTEATESDDFGLIEADASRPPKDYLSAGDAFEFIFHLASPASPRGFIDRPVETYLVNAFGTHYLAEYAIQSNARILFASTSEIYGDPKEHPQKEAYWGNVNPIGIRACYDESKRFGEMVLTTLARERVLDARIVRIFNTYGPRMDPKDGRVVPNFILQALKNEPMTVHGDGTQTRSFCYVSDLVKYILRAMLVKDRHNLPINIGNDDEYTVLDFARKIKQLTGSRAEIVFVDRPEDDPNQRRPDLTRAKKILRYHPQVSLDEGLKLTIDYFRSLRTDRLPDSLA